MARKTGSTTRSFFEYSITRPYPFRWFTPLTISLGLLAVVLFSVINVASSGYTLVVQSTNNPNKTLAENTWVSRWPSFINSKAQSTCQPMAIPVKSQLFTNNTALTYTLIDVWQEDDGGGKNILSSLPYYNNVIEECSVSAIDMDFESQDRSAVQLSHSEWGVRVSIYATCSINNPPKGSTIFDLAMYYNFVPSTVRYGEQKGFLDTMFLSRDLKKKASLWWGETILSSSWAYTCRMLQDIRQNRTDYNERMITKSTFNYRPSATVKTDITDLAFFDLDYQLVTVDWGAGTYFELPPHHESPAKTAKLDAEEVFPNIWIAADTLAKAAYSTVLTDLGQVLAPHNLLTDPDQLQFFTANISHWRAHIANAIPGPADQDYDTLKSKTGKLGASPSVFAMDYLCQVPQRKAAANLIVSVLVADLVFLQATWNIYKLIVDYFFVGKLDNHSWCEGCDRRAEAAEGIPLTEIGSEAESSGVEIQQPEVPLGQGSIGTQGSARSIV